MSPISRTPDGRSAGFQSFGEKPISPNSNVLRRKLRSDPKGPADQAVSPAKAARVSLARAADKAFNLALRVNGIRQSRLDLADAVDQMEEDWALFPLVHEDGSVGVMCLEPACVIAFVERQTLGRVNQDAGDVRRLTHTDKALAESFLTEFLHQFDEALQGAPTAYWTCGYRAEDAVLSRHLMVLQLDGSEYRGFDMQSEIVEAQRSVSIRFFLPIKEKVTSKSERKKQPAGADGKLSGGTSQKMRSSALAANVEMDAVMCKVFMPLSELNNLQPGQLVHLPQNATQQAHLVDKTGRTAQTVRLGQLHGMRAVRLLHEPADAEMVSKPVARPEKREKKTEPLRVPAAVPEQTSEQMQEVSQNNEVQDELDMLLAASKT